MLKSFFLYAKKWVLITVILIVSNTFFAQNVQTDVTTYTSQQLIEDILINSNCITNVTVTNVIGGNFGGSDQSYGYFNASGSSFPFQEGIVLSTGRLSNVDGPNTSLSDDGDDSSWNGDNDLETILNQSNTTNATTIEFEFTSTANQISFNYIFASEEYQENNSNTCQYSDLFGFLIRPINDQQYTNIALVPNTQTPVKVTTVHPAIPNGCEAQNEYYFESWNDSSAPINFNGQTKVLTATADIIPNETYHVKLVIADEQNYRYDSAVFLEAGSFKLSTDLSEDRLFETNNPLCFGETLDLDAFTSGANVTYKWFKNGSELLGEISNIYTVQDEGVYNVEVTFNGTCDSYGEITINYAQELDTNQNYLSSCDNDSDGITFFDLHLADPFYKIDMTGLTVVDFYRTPENANDNLNPIPDPTVFFNTLPNQVVFARIENQDGCFEVESLTLQANYTSLSIGEFNVCDDNFDGFTTFNLDELRSEIAPEVSSTATISFFDSYNDAANNQKQLPTIFENTIPYSQVIWVKAHDVFCELLTSITLNVLNKPELMADEEQLYCLNTFPQTLTLNAGLLNITSGETYVFEWKKDDLDLGLNQEEIGINEAGSYSVKVSNQNNCFTERAIQVNSSESAIIENIEIESQELESDVTIVVLGIGDYEFSIDNGAFQTENSFYNVSGGFHEIAINDLNGCGIVKEEILVFGIPRFFTPNDDGKNDTWIPKGNFLLENSITEIYIFNRFGKLLTQLDVNGVGWNGIFNGKIMPSTDYWYKLVFQDGQIFQGHFSLIR